MYKLVIGLTLIIMLNVSNNSSGYSKNEDNDYALAYSLMANKLEITKEEIVILDVDKGDFRQDGSNDIVIVATYPFMSSSNETNKEITGIYLFTEVDGVFQYNDETNASRFSWLTYILKELEETTETLETTVAIKQGELHITTGSNENSGGKWRYIVHDKKGIKIKAVETRERNTEENKTTYSSYNMEKGTILKKVYTKTEGKLWSEEVYDGIFEIKDYYLNDISCFFEKNLYTIEQSNIQACLKDKELNLPKDAIILDFTLGYIGFDNNLVFAFVAQYEEQNSLKREVCVFTQNLQNGYTYQYHNKDLVGSSKQGISNDDFYDNIAISSRELLITQVEKGSVDISTIYSFVEIKDELQLNTIEILETSGESELHSRTTYDYIAGKSKHVVFLEEDHSNRGKITSEGAFYNTPIPFDKVTCNQHLTLLQLDSEDVKAIVKNRLLEEKLIKKQMGEAPNNYALYDFYTGDLGNDGYQDIIAVVSCDKKGSEIGKYLERSLYWFKETSQGEFAFVLSNTGLIADSASGGMLGDPYSGIQIEEGIMSVHSYGGSSGRRSASYYFSVSEEQMLLSKVEKSEMSSHVKNKLITTYNLEEKTVQVKISAVKKEYLVYEGELEVTKPITIANYPEYDQLASTTSWSPMPTLYDCIYEYETEYEAKDGSTITIEDLNFSAQETLDLVQQKYYPNMEKASQTCGEEILNNYTELLKYEVPKFYYENGNNKLYYFGVEYDRDYKHWKHTIKYSSKHDGNKVYYVWDDTGKVKLKQEKD